jgi:hypothetical protein
MFDVYCTVVAVVFASLLSAVGIVLNTVAVLSLLLFRYAQVIIIRGHKDILSKFSCDFFYPRADVRDDYVVSSNRYRIRTVNRYWINLLES